MRKETEIQGITKENIQLLLSSDVFQLHAGDFRHLKVIKTCPHSLFKGSKWSRSIRRASGAVVTGHKLPPSTPLTSSYQDLQIKLNLDCALKSFVASFINCCDTLTLVLKTVDLKQNLRFFNMPQKSRFISIFL